MDRAGILHLVIVVVVVFQTMVPYYIIACMEGQLNNKCYVVDSRRSLPLPRHKLCVTTHHLATSFVTPLANSHLSGFMCIVPSVVVYGTK